MATRKKKLKKKSTKKKAVKKESTKKTKKKAVKKKAKKKVTKNKSKKNLSKKATRKKSTNKKVAKKKPAAKNKATAKKKVKANKNSTSKNKTKKLSAVVATKKPKAANKTKPKCADISWQDFFAPLDDRVLVMPQAKDAVTESGIILVESSKPTPNKGEVLSVGRGHQNKKGKIRPMDLKIGDVVLFGEYAGTQCKILGKNLLILRETDIHAIIES